MNKCFKSSQHSLECDLRKISEKDSKKFWKILEHFDKNNSATELKFSIDQLYPYFKSLNKIEDADTDNQDIDKLIENIDNQDNTNILDRGTCISEEEFISR